MLADRLLPAKTPKVLGASVPGLDLQIPVEHRDSGAQANLASAPEDWAQRSRPWPISTPCTEPGRC
jgi:hypothetical protein